jgi:hypothetical protein
VAVCWSGERFFLVETPRQSFPDSPDYSNSLQVRCPSEMDELGKNQSAVIRLAH